MIMRRRWRWALLAASGLVLALGLAVAGWGYGRLRASLPAIDGRERLAGLAASVTVTRDALGIPTIRGQSREDVARVTGFLHAQDRFFQMDLSRRRAAGELSALVGGRALALDVEIRRHRFRALVERAIAMMAPTDRRILDAYTAGVNGGLASLKSPSFEYLLL